MYGQVSRGDTSNGIHQISTMGGNVFKGIGTCVRVCVCGF